MPEYQDRVKHKTASDAILGTVIAKYQYEVGLQKTTETLAIPIYQSYLDVRSDDGKIYYETPEENWETISTEEENYE